MKTIILAFLLFLPCLAAAWTGECVKVVDGDTIDVRKGGEIVRIRLRGVDCPEKKEPFSKEAKDFTTSMALNRTVTVKPVEKDRHGRTVAWITVDGKSLNHELVRAGWATWYQKYEPNNNELKALEAQAKQKGLGIWSKADGKKDDKDKDSLGWNDKLTIISFLLSLALGLWTLFKGIWLDRARLQIRGEIKRYSEKLSYINFTVTNIGRRPITITGASYYRDDDQNVKPIPYFYPIKDDLPKTLNEAVPWQGPSLHLDTILHMTNFRVFDSTGKCWLIRQNILQQLKTLAAKEQARSRKISQA